MWLCQVHTSPTAVQSESHRSFIGLGYRTSLAAIVTTRLRVITFAQASSAGQSKALLSRLFWRCQGGGQQRGELRGSFSIQVETVAIPVLSPTVLVYRH